MSAVAPDSPPPPAPEGAADNPGQPPPPQPADGPKLQRMDSRLPTLGPAPTIRVAPKGAGRARAPSLLVTDATARVLPTLLDDRATAAALPFLIFRSQSPRRIAWDLVVILLLAYITVVTPYRIGLEAAAEGAWKVFERVLDVLFIVDIAVNFRTTYLDELTGLEVSQPDKIARKYLRTWFLVDFVSSIPFEMLFEGLENVQSAKVLKAGRAIKAVRVLRLTKLARFLKASVWIEKLDETIAVGRNTIKMSKMLLGTLCLAHLNACAWAFVARQGEYEVRSWAAEAGVADDSRSRQYLTALYWSVSTMTTVGYGDILPYTQAEQIYSIWSMILGGGFYGYIIASMASLVSNLDANSRSYHDKMDRISSFMKAHRFPKPLYRRVRRYYRHYFDRRSALDPACVLDGLSVALRNEVAVALLNDIVRSVDLFAELDGDAMAALVGILKPLQLGAGEVVYREGDRGHEMFLVVSGSLAALATTDAAAAAKGGSDDDGHEPEQLEFETGSYFGELAALGLHDVRLQTVSTRSPVEMYVLAKRDLYSALTHRNDAFLHLEALVRERHARLLQRLAGAAVQPQGSFELLPGTPGTPGTPQQQQQPPPVGGWQAAAAAGELQSASADEWQVEMRAMMAAMAQLEAKLDGLLPAGSLAASESPGSESPGGTVRS